MDGMPSAEKVTAAKFVLASLLALLCGVLVTALSSPFWGHAADLLVFVGVLALPVKPSPPSMP